MSENELIPRASTVTYPMVLTAAGTFQARSQHYRSQLHFLLDFPEGARFWDPFYGTNLEELEQAAGELDYLLPVHLFRLRKKITQYLPVLHVEGVMVTKDTQQNRTVRFDVLFRAPTEATIRREQFESSLIWRS